MYLNLLRKLAHRTYLWYLRWFPINGGKYHIGVILNWCVGRALYKIDGAYLELSPVSVIDRKLISGEGHDQAVVNVIRESLCAGGNIIDVGANIGYMSVLAARILDGTGNVFSFEPSPREYKRLVENIRLNAFSNITAFNKGIGPTRQKSLLHIATIGNPGLNSRYNIADGLASVEAEFVPIADAIPESELRAVKCIKIDVEGDEMSVLMGFEKSMHLLREAIFVVEIVEDYLKEAGHTPKDIYSYFSRHSFQPVNGTEPRKTFEYDAVFIASE